MLYGTLTIDNSTPVNQLAYNNTTNQFEVTQIPESSDIIIGHYDALLNCLLCITGSKEKLKPFVSIEKLRFWVGNSIVSDIIELDTIELIKKTSFGDPRTKSLIGQIGGSYKKIVEKMQTFTTQLKEFSEEIKYIEQLNASQLSDGIEAKLIQVTPQLLNSITLDKHTPILSFSSETDTLLNQSIAAQKDFFLPHFQQYWGLLSANIHWDNLNKEHMASALMFMANNSTYVATAGVIAGCQTADGTNRPLQYYRSQANHPFFSIVSHGLDKYIKELSNIVKKLPSDIEKKEVSINQEKFDLLIFEKTSEILTQESSSSMFIDKGPLIDLLLKLSPIDQLTLQNAETELALMQTKLKFSKQQLEEASKRYALISNISASNEILKTIYNQDTKIEDFLKKYDKNNQVDNKAKIVLDNVSAGLRFNNIKLITNYLELKLKDQTTNNALNELRKEVLPNIKNIDDEQILNQWRSRDALLKLENFDPSIFNKETSTHLYQDIFDRRIATVNKIFSNSDKTIQYFDKDGKVTTNKSAALVTIFRSSDKSGLIQIQPFFIHSLIKKANIEVGRNNTKAKLDQQEGVIIENERSAAGNINLTEKIYINNILAIFTAAITAISNLTQSDHIYMRRQSFGFLSTTLSDTALSIRLSVGIEPTDKNTQILLAGFKCLATFLNTLKQQPKEIETFTKQLHFDGGNEVTEQQLITTLTRAFKRKCQDAKLSKDANIETASTMLAKQLATSKLANQICINLEHIHMHKDGLTAGWDWPEESDTSTPSRLTRQNSRTFADSEYKLPATLEMDTVKDPLLQSVLKADLYMLAQHTNIAKNQQYPQLLTHAINVINKYAYGDEIRPFFGLLNARKLIHDHLPFYIPTNITKPIPTCDQLYITDGGQQALVITCAILLRYYDLTHDFCYFELPGIIKKITDTRTAANVQLTLTNTAFIFDPSPTLTTPDEAEKFELFYKNIEDQIKSHDLLIVDITNASPQVFKYIDDLIKKQNNGKGKDVIYLASGLKHMQLGIDKYQFGFVYPRFASEASKSSAFAQALKTGLAKVQNESSTAVRDRLVKQFINILPFWD